MLIITSMHNRKALTWPKTFNQAANFASMIRPMRFLFVVFCIYSCAYHDVSLGMHQKRGHSEYLQTVAPSKRFREDVTEMFLSNRIPGDRAMQLLRNSELAGVRNVSHLTKSYRQRPQSTKNDSRNLRRRLVKHSKWPKPYYVVLDCMDTKTGKAKKMTVPMWLPHEIVQCLVQESKGGLLIHLLQAMFVFLIKGSKVNCYLELYIELETFWHYESTCKVVARALDRCRSEAPAESCRGNRDACSTLALSRHLVRRSAF